MRSRSRVGALTVFVVLLALLVPFDVARADPGDPEPEPDPPQPTTLTLDATRAAAGNESRLRISLQSAEATPVPEAAVILERRLQGTWRLAAEVDTDAAGTATVGRTLFRKLRENRFRATYDGDEAYAASASDVVLAPLRRREGLLQLTGPRTVPDGHRVRLRVVSRTRSGETVPGPVRVLRRLRGQDWRQVRKVATGGQGKARVRIRPRVDTRWRVVTPAQAWVTGARSAVLRIDNVPPVAPVRLPKGAPKPRVRVPTQRSGTGRGANPVVTRIPDGVWRSMIGRSWHQGCPVGRDGLRLLRINYWGYDGYRHRGELVAATGAMGAMSRSLVGLYRARLPLRSLYRVDRFGWSPKLQGANDYKSMAAGNTSAFNCRQVVNRPGVRSPHSYGRSLDLNTWENPYRSPTGLVPNTWWQSRSHPLVAWRSRSHRVVQILTREGFRWTYGLSDTQHFDLGGGHGRAAHRHCGGAVCD